MAYSERNKSANKQLNKDKRSNIFKKRDEQLKKRQKDKN